MRGVKEGDQTGLSSGHAPEKEFDNNAPCGVLGSKASNR